MGAIERARIYELDANDGKVDPNGIEVCFNPKEYSLEKAVSWESSKAHADAPVPEFKSPAAMTLSVTLQFDTYEQRISVRDKYVRKIESLTMMKGTAKDEKDVKKHAPPRILFVWGKMTFKGVIDSLSQKFTMFLSDGTPVRAEVALKIRNVLDSAIDTGTNASSRQVDGGTRSYTVQDGDRLDLIAANELGNAGRWPEIAAINGIDNPADLSAFTTIEIPVA